MKQKTPLSAVLLRRTQRYVWVGLLLVFAAVLLATSVLRPVEAATSDTINFQARLQQSSGALVPDGFYNVEFKLYNASSSTGSSQGSCSGDSNCLWTETRHDSNGASAGNDNRVRVANGYLTVNLGSVTAFGGSIDWSQELWLTMNVGGTTQTATPDWDDEMDPRLKLTAVPHAFSAGELKRTDGDGDTGTLEWGSLSADRTVTLPDEDGIVCIQESSACGFLVGDATDYIQNGTDPQTADFNITGAATVGSLTTDTIDTGAGGGTLTIGDTNADNVTIGDASTSIGVDLSLGAVGVVAGDAGILATDAGVSIQRNGTDSATAFRVQNAATDSIFNVDTTGTGTVSLGEADDAATLFILDTKNTDGDPTGVEGAMYYNSFLGKYRCYKEGAWKNCDGGADAVGTAAPISKVADRGQVATNGTQSSTDITLNDATSIEPGNYLVARVAWGTGSGGTMNVTDPQGNTWSVVGPATSGSTSTYVAYTRVDNAYQTDDVITFQPSVSANTRAIIVEEWRNINATDPVIGDEVLEAGTGTNPSITRTPTEVGQLFYGHLGVGGGTGDSFTQDADTLEGGWQTLTRLGANITSNGAGKVVEGTSEQTWDPTLGSSRDWGMVGIIFKPALVNEFRHGGNEFGETAVLGTLDDNGLDFITNDTTVASLTNTGEATFQNSEDSSDAFRIINQGGDELFGVDTDDNILSLLGNNSGEVADWQTATNSLPDVRRNHATTTANGYVYVMGGRDGSLDYQDTVYYAKLNSDGSVGTWQTAANALPTDLAYATSVTANGYVYVMGGYDGSSIQDTVYYAKLNSDGSVGTWQTAANALPADREYATSVTANGYVYVMGGNGNDTVYYAKLNSDGSVGTWQTAANALPADRGLASSATANGYVYVMGGHDGSNQDTVYYAQLNNDGSVGTWQTAANALPAARAGATSVTANGYVYVMGGDNSNDTVYYAKLNSDGSIGTWQTAANALPTDHEYATSITANGYIYIMGGDGNDTVYYASTARVQLGGSLDLVGLQGSGSSITAGDGTFIGNLQVEGMTMLNNGLAVNGATTLQHDAEGAFTVLDGAGDAVFNIDTSNSEVEIGGHVLPIADDTYDLGSNTQRWRDLYLGPNSLHIGENGDEGVISYNTSTDEFEFDKSISVQGDVTATGASTFQNSADSGEAFRVLNSGGDRLMNIDTLSSQIIFGGTLASGGNKIYYENGYVYHEFTSSGDFVVDASVDVEYLIVGGGGGGGRDGPGGDGGGGGGAGGVLDDSTTLAPDTYSIVVGDGGAGSVTTAAGTGGGDSSAFSDTAVGGGGGGGSAGTGQSGGSGGGGGAVSGSGGSGTGGQGNAGGDSDTGGSAGGGGGVGGIGEDGDDSVFGVGGAGGSGTTIWGLYSVAGGGGGGASTGGSGSSGGGDGATGTTSTPATAGIDGTGGGGGGGFSTENGADGGDGIVVARYPVADNVTNAISTDIFGDLNIIGGATFQNSTDSTEAFQILNAAGDSLVNVDTTNDEITFGGHVLPSADDTYDLGSSENRWRDLYLGPNSLHIGEDGDEGVISYNTSTDEFEFDKAISFATNDSSIDSPGLKVVQQGSGDASMEFSVDSLGNGFYAGQDASNSGSFVINSSTAATGLTTPTHVQSDVSAISASADTDVQQEFSSGVTSGNTIVAAVTWFSDATDSVSCSDNQGNSYTVVHQEEHANQQRLAVCYATNVNAGATTVTATFGASEDWRAISVSEYAGVMTADPVDGFTGNTGSSANPTTTSTTTNYDGNLVFGAVMATSGTNWSGDDIAANGDFIERTESDGLSVADLVQNPAGSIAADWTFDASENYAAALVAFRAAPAGSFTDTFNNAIFTLSQTGSLGLQNVLDSGNAFQVQNAGGSSVFNIDTTGNGNVSLGEADANATLFTLDSSSAVSDPTEAPDGSMYYNTDMNEFRCRINGSWANCGGTSGGNNFMQGGNDFDATAVLGTTDADELHLMTDNNAVATFGTDGAATFKNSANSANAFQIQNAAGDSVLNVNTENNTSTFNSSVSINNNSGANAFTINSFEGITVTDDFNRADENPLGGDWTTITDCNDLQLSSNEVTGTSSSSCAYWNADTLSDDQYAEVELTGGNDDGGPIVRASSGAETYYTTWGTGGDRYITKRVGGSASTIGAPVATTGEFQTGDIMRLEVVGDTLTLYRNGTPLGSRTDTSIASGSPGIYGWGSGTQFDNFEAGNVVTGGSGQTTFTIDSSGHITSQGVSNSTTAFQIQNAAGAGLLTADTNNMEIIVGDSTDGVILSADGLELRGTARHAKAIVLTPEYAGAVLDGTGTGLMTAARDNTENMNYYRWTSSESTSQTYDIVVSVPVPSDWNAWAASSELCVETYSSDVALATASLSVLDTDGDSDFSGSDITPSSGGVWDDTQCFSLADAEYSADGVMTITISTSAQDDESIQIGNITLSYLGKF